MLVEVLHSPVMNSASTTERLTPHFQTPTTAGEDIQTPSATDPTMKPSRILPETVSATAPVHAQLPKVSNPGFAGPAHDNSHEWDHLLQWQQLDGDQELDWTEAEDSHDLEENDSQGTVDEELSDRLDFTGDIRDFGKRTEKFNKLAPDQIGDIINEQIEYFTNIWFPNKDALTKDMIDTDPRRLWQMAEGQGKRFKLVQKYRAEVEYLSGRLDKLCDEIVRTAASKPEGIRQQCKNLEVTVYSLELAKWLLHIYELESVPNSEEGVMEMDTGIKLPQTNLQSQSDIHGPDVNADNMAGAHHYGPSSFHVGSRTGDTNQPVHITSDKRGGQPEPPLNTQTPGSNTSEWNHPRPPGQPLRPGQLCIPLSHLSNKHSDRPEDASIVSVRKWCWNELVATQDRKRIVSKVVYQMEDAYRELFRMRLRLVDQVSMTREVSDCIRMLSRGETDMPGIIQQDLLKISLITSLFMSWWFCNNSLQDLPDQPRLQALYNSLEYASNDLRVFHVYLATIMSKTFSEEALKHPDRPPPEDIIEISSDDDDLKPNPLVQRPKRLHGSQRSVATVVN